FRRGRLAEFLKELIEHGIEPERLLHRHAFARHPLKAGLPVEHLVLVATWPKSGSHLRRPGKALAWAEVVTRLRGCTSQQTSASAIREPSFRSLMNVLRFH